MDFEIIGNYIFLGVPLPKYVAEQVAHSPCCLTHRFIAYSPTNTGELSFFVRMVKAENKSAPFSFAEQKNQ
jgi:hypothetical protein